MVGWVAFILGLCIVAIAAVFFVLVSLIPGWVKKRYGAAAGTDPEKNK